METDCCAQNGNTHAHAFITFKCWFLTERNWVKSCHVCAQNGNTHAHAFITFKCWFLTERNWVKSCHVCAQNVNTHAHAFITFKCWFLTERNWVKSCHVCAQNGNTHAHAFITFKCWFLTERNWVKICHVCLKKKSFLSAGPVMFFFGLVFPLNINFLLCSLLPYISFVLIHMWEKTAPRDVSPTCWETLDCSCFRIEENSNELPSPSR